MDEMVAILESQQQYVPTVPANEVVEIQDLCHSIWRRTEYVVSLLVSINGKSDTIIAQCRGRADDCCQDKGRIRSNSDTDIERLEGFTAVIEDCHAKVLFLGVS
jgi:hypothetical protein